jgi:hypothetical protein
MYVLIFSHIHTDLNGLLNDLCPCTIYRVINKKIKSATSSFVLTKRLS